MLNIKNIISATNIKNMQRQEEIKRQEIRKENIKAKLKTKIEELQTLIDQRLTEGFLTAEIDIDPDIEEEIQEYLLQQSIVLKNLDNGRKEIRVEIVPERFLDLKEIELIISITNSEFLKASAVVEVEIPRHGTYKETSIKAVAEALLGAGYYIYGDSYQDKFLVVSLYERKDF